MYFVQTCSLFAEYVAENWRFASRGQAKRKSLGFFVHKGQAFLIVSEQELLSACFRLVSLYRSGSRFVPVSQTPAGPHSRKGICAPVLGEVCSRLIFPAGSTFARLEPGAQPMGRTQQFSFYRTSRLKCRSSSCFSLDPRPYPSPEP